MIHMLKSLISNFIHNKKVVLFAINNTCNCRCEMCSIWKFKNKKIIRFEEAKKTLSKLRKNNFGYIQITGGEPLLNPDAMKIMTYAKKLGFSIFLVTNGTLIDESIAKKLSEIKVDNIGISFHHYNGSIFEKISNHKNILNKVLTTIKLLKKENIPVEALFTISNYNKNDIEKTVEFINSLDIGINFCMPMTTKKTSFSLGGDCVKFSDEELKKIILQIIRLKKEGYNIINNITFLNEVINFLDGKSKYYCLGGFKIFYLDWNLNLYSCMFKGEPINIENANFNSKKEICNKCLFQCFREPSLFLISKPVTLKITIQELPTYFKLVRNR